MLKKKLTSFTGHVKVEHSAADWVLLQRSILERGHQLEWMNTTICLFSLAQQNTTLWMWNSMCVKSSPHAKKTNKGSSYGVATYQLIWTHRLSDRTRSLNPRNNSTARAVSAVFLYILPIKRCALRNTSGSRPRPRAITLSTRRLSSLQCWKKDVWISLNGNKAPDGHFYGTGGQNTGCLKPTLTVLFES